ncbi:MAG TPA: dihydrodipicolinate synthase family protein [Bacteroidetes bacterium]|nr:dihydrodipicolinate synthase family protein [Bacteroidota bacterium]HRR08558.1 dihydrodipicolinate synthase family protein [Rhodothermales bacterium]
MNVTPWQGVFSAVTTKFTSDFSLDIARMEQHFAEQMAAGIHGIIVNGSLGENASLNTEEKLENLKIALRVAGGRIPVLSGVAETTTKAVIQFVDAGTKLGASGFMVLPPMRYPAEAHETIHHFKTVGKASSVPIMVYNNPVAYKVDVSPAMFAELAEVPQLIALKESSDNVRRVTDIVNWCGNRFQIFTGVDNIALESLLAGAVGWVAGLVCAFPKETVAIYEHAMAGRVQEAVALYRWFRPLLDLDVTPRFVHYIKYTEALVSGKENDALVRDPRLPMPEIERKQVEAIVRKALENRPDC